MALSDQAVLAANAAFISRVQESLVATCVAIQSEATSTAYHYSRARFATQVMQQMATQPTQWPQAFAFSVATDANVISDATAAGTVTLTSGNVATQQALITDAHINAAVSGQFNSFFNVAT